MVLFSPFFLLDKQWLQENLLTLLSNAVKYSIHGPVSLSITLATERHIIGLANRRRGSLRGSWEENRGEKGENRGEIRGNMSDKGGQNSSSKKRRKSSFTAQLSASIQRSIESLSQHTRPADPVAIANDLPIMPHTSPNPSPHHHRSHGLGVLRSDSASSASPVDSHLQHQHQLSHDDHPTLFSLPSLRQLFVKTSSLLQVLPSLPSLTLAGPTKIHPQSALSSSKKGLGPPEEVLYVLFEVTDSGML